MAKDQGKKGLIVTIIILGLTVLVVGAIAAVQNSNRQTTAETSGDTSSTTDDTSSDESTSSDTPAEEPVLPTVDPSTLSSIAIEPLKLTVYYTKGIGGFEYAVKRTTEGTRYVEFSAPELAGTKCTDDTGVFASIITSPASEEDKATLTQTVVVDGVTYGLSLSAKNCTSNVSLLEKYQTGFTDGFSELKALP